MFGFSARYNLERKWTYYLALIQYLTSIPGYFIPDWNQSTY